MRTHLYDSFHSLERILEGNQELSKEVLKKFGGHVECNGCKTIYKNKKLDRGILKRIPLDPWFK